MLGLGLGMVMQILVMAVQNAVPYERLGVATSGTTLFRSIGGSVGAALFGGIFAFVLHRSIETVACRHVQALSDPTAIAKLAEPMRSTYLALFVAALHPVFYTASVLALISFFLSLAIQEVPLRTSIAPETVGDALPDAARCHLARRAEAHRHAHNRARKPLARLPTLGPAHRPRTRAGLSCGCWHASARAMAARRTRTSASFGSGNLNARRCSTGSSRTE